MRRRSLNLADSAAIFASKSESCPARERRRPTAKEPSRLQAALVPNARIFCGHFCRLGIARTALAAIRITLGE